MTRVCGRGHRYTGGRCPTCERARDRQRGTATARGYDAEYRAERAPLIGQPCELRLSGCTGIADTADHVVPVSRGGRRGPLRPACSSCNFARGNRDVVRGVGVKS